MKTKDLLIFILAFGLCLSGVASGETWFEENFEGETIGDMPSQWELFGGAEGQGAEVVEDPLDPNNNVFFVNSPVWVGDLPEGAWAPKDQSFLEWTDYIFEGDFMVDDPTKLFAYNYRATDYDNLLHCNTRRWETGLIGLYKRENGEWSGTVIEVQHPTEANVWYTVQIIAEGDHHILKIKEENDQTDFAEIDPIIEVDAVGTDLDVGTINVMSYGYVDDIIVYVGEKAVQPGGKSATTWAGIKDNYRR